MRTPKKLSHTLLLICEGENTEPEYFQKLADIAMANETYSHVEIYPRPKEEKQKTAKKSTRRPIRQFNEGNKSVPDRLVEQADEEELPFSTVHKGVETWATPVRYIKEARDRIKTGEYDEIWAIFDKDGHAKHKQAFKLAALPILDKVVNIAFSSISFEHWILLHFEKSSYPFIKSECKDKDTKSIECGSGVHTDDCGGSKCVAGVLVQKGCLPSYNKTADSGLFAQISGKTELAIENAAWLRMVQTDRLATNPIWEINPITTIDVLVKKLLNIDKRITWMNLGVPMYVKQLECVIRNVDNNFIISITNHTGKNLTSNQFSLVLNNIPDKLRYEPSTVLAHGNVLEWNAGIAADINRIELNFEFDVLLFENS
jgi:hypothetical protein